MILAYFSGDKSIFENFTNLEHWGSLGGVGNNDVLVVERFDKLGKFADVHVFAGDGAVGVLVDVEGAFGDEDFAIDDVFELGEIDVLGITEIGNNGNFDGVVDLDALLFQFDDLRACELGVFGFDFFSFFDDAKTDGGFAVLCGENADEEIWFYFVFVAGFYTDEVCGDLVSVEADPAIDNLAHRANEGFGSIYGSRGQVAEVAVREVVGDAGGVVHVAVGEQDIIYGDNLVGGLTDVEADVELGDGDDGLFTGDGIADDVEVVDFYMCQIVA